MFKQITSGSSKTFSKIQPLFFFSSEIQIFMEITPLGKISGTLQGFNWKLSERMFPGILSRIHPEVHRNSFQLNG